MRIEERIYKNFATLAEIDPHLPCIQSGAKLLTYSEFFSTVSNYSQLIEKHVQGDSFVVVMEDSIASYALILAGFFRGKTYVPVSYGEAAERIQKIVSDCESQVVFTSVQKKHDLEEILADAVGLTVIEADLDQLLFSTSSLELETSESPTYILYTSGSTGTPKGIPIFAENLENFLLWSKDYFDVKKGDSFLCHPRLIFDLSVFNMYLPLMVGGKMTLLEELGHQLFPGEVLEQGITHVLWAPRITQNLIQSDQMGNIQASALRHVLFCGEPLRKYWVDVWQRTHPNVTLHNLYGPTEATVACSYYTLDKKVKLKEPLPIGQAIPGCELELLDPELEPNGELIGELLIKGKQVSRQGYIKGPQGGFRKNAQGKMEFATGDIVRLDEDGLFYWLARKDQQVKVKGYRVELGEIESAFFSHSNVSDVVVLFDAAAEELCALVQLEGVPIEDFKQAAREDLKAVLPHYMFPTHIIAVNQIPKNERGKVDKQACWDLIGKP